MLISAAVCPHPPLLVPEVSGGAAPELDGLRDACDQAVRELSTDTDTDTGDTVVDTLIVVGGGPETRRYGPDAYGDLRPYGLDLTFTHPKGTVRRERLPLSLTIGCWLLTRSPEDVPQDVRYQAVAEDAEPGECLRLGHELAGSAERVALLVMGDASACRSEKAPGYLDGRAEPFDAGVARAFGNADAASLAELDPGLCRDLVVAGRAAWQVLAGAAGGDRFGARLLADEAPYGVGYLAASWRRSG
ncbi:class III extradiol dioxygenase subunit B-like domain-containing protein [Actinomadura barringtoniae]|uniref:Class III extradiol dioxygenase subunit B-like domain-containing protein n=1 Tax=Actinomadura barringtoniae TaxID=1427535 RepID=A0A939P6W8_9ACTN|nr:class III extradiol dioxygenase subunit B-like domain-containing protein [Actinomadura barringtoniae]MBO2446600.1 class III extradiol dioxygenase subunit B-like domain-containing protein [Actinomadura barringtoniae]